MKRGEQGFALFIPADPENIILAREVTGGLLESWKADRGVIDDVKIALTEACDNAIIHGYGGKSGQAVQIRGRGFAGGYLELSVLDAGSGVTPGPKVGLGMGLPLIASVSDVYEMSGKAEGTSVRMGFDLGRGSPPLSGDAERFYGARSAAANPLLVTGVRSLVGRFLVAAAAGSGLNVDQVSDLCMAMDLSLDAVVPGAVAETEVEFDERRLAFRIFPIRPEVVNLAALHQIAPTATIDKRSIEVEIEAATP